MILQKEFVSHWHTHIENMTQTPKEFYNSIELLIKEQQLPDVKIRRVKYNEKGFFSTNREYLQIKSKGYFFEICSAAYGRGFFVSYWQRENRSVKASLLERIPGIGRLLKAFTIPETFFTIDTRLMFQGAVHSCVIHAIDSMLQAKGMKALSETQKAVPLASN